MGGRNGVGVRFDPFPELAAEAEGGGCSKDRQGAWDFVWVWSCPPTAWPYRWEINFNLGVYEVVVTKIQVKAEGR
jgi:hypothetical protein